MPDPEEIGARLLAKEIAKNHDKIASGECPKCGSTHIVEVDTEKDYSHEDYLVEKEGDSTVYYYYECQEDFCGAKFTMMKKTTWTLHEISYDGKGVK